MRTPLAFVLALAALGAVGARAADAGPATATARDLPVHGKVLEVIPAGSYTYLRLAGPAGELWAAVPRAALQPGAEVAIANPMPMDGFESRILQRTFERIVFGTLAGTQPAGEASIAMPMDAVHSQALQIIQSEAHGPAAASAGIRVDRAPGPTGHTVAELFESRAALKDARVSVRGKVVKSSSNILGRNWLHLQDGTGRQGSADLTVTTRDEVAAGEVVLADGVLRLERDFGAGYRYALIIEDARISR